MRPLKAPVFLLTVFSFQICFAGSISDSYNAGDTLTATMMDNIKSAVNDNDSRATTLESTSSNNDSRITTLESDSTSQDSRITTLESATADFSGYGMPFSAIGTSKNVVIQKVTTDGTIIGYFLRSRYENNTETVSVNGVQVVRPFIANYVSVGVDAVGNITSITKTIEAPATSSYLDYVFEFSAYDPITIAKTVTGDTASQIEDCAESPGSSIRICIRTRTDSATTPDTITQTHSTQNFLLGGSMTINGLSFPDVRWEQQAFDSFSRVRIRAKGIGEIKRMISSTQVHEVEYYRVDGQTGGALSGPFVPGGALDGLFF